MITIDAFADQLIDRVITILRADRSLPPRSEREWFLLFGDLRRSAAFELDELITENVVEAVNDAKAFGEIEIDDDELAKLKKPANT